MRRKNDHMEDDRDDDEGEISWYYKTTSSDGGNTGDGVKIAGGVIGSGGEIGAEVEHPEPGFELIAWKRVEIGTFSFVVSSGWSFVSAILGQMTYPVASPTLDSAGISPEGFLPSILLLVVIIVMVVVVIVILIVVVVDDVSLILKLSL
ncbi:hypothetical protein Tco_1492268 [Tanacetum coccineum]